MTAKTTRQSATVKTKPSPTRRAKPPRLSLFDYVTEVEKSAESNKYGSVHDLGNEASVEQFFLARLNPDLGYNDAEIRPKESLETAVISGGGRKKENYRPDYMFTCNGKPRWLIDAKATNEDVDDWAYQGAGYALWLNQQFVGEDPCQYYVITNGLELKVWRWNERSPILFLTFTDFVDDSPAFLQLRALLGADAARKGWAAAKATKQAVTYLFKPSVEDAKRLFKSCHDLIWKSEKMNPQRAFFEFVKIMFVKLYEDKKIHEDAELGPLVASGESIPRDSLVFSVRWVESLEAAGVDNPIDSVLFQKLARTIGDAVKLGKKKPIFPDGERISLQPGTLKQVVARLERYDMFGIDEDLNGRLFETFLNATMRGQALGQFFTPRSVVKLMTKAAAPHATRTYVDKVIDACCGSGGFLIEVLTEMRNEVRANGSLSEKESAQLNEQIANEALFGIDAGQDPPLARIARINMYLHGDGGSRIYAADSLDKAVKTGVGDSPSTELDELRGILTGGGGFDIALTNPPFSMGYSINLPAEEEILNQYALTTFGHAGTTKKRNSLSSRVMFIERYADLLKPGGKLLTVIDDATLSTRNLAFARSFMRERFIVRAVISLPGDAFQRVGARAKTSILYLVKREAGDTSQPDVFMAESSYIGLDDVPTKTPKSKADTARAKAEKETSEILADFERFLAGESGPWLAPASAIGDRLDVKFCLPRDAAQNVATEWQANGYVVMSLGSIVDPVTDAWFKPKDTPDAEFTFLRVSYDGVAEEGERRLGREITYSEVQRASGNDLVASNIAMAYGAVCVLPQGLEHALASSEFTIMRIKDERFNPWFLWGFLRSPEVRARLLSQATGLQRHRVEWDFLKEIPVPLVPRDIQDGLGQQYQDAVDAVRQAAALRLTADTQLFGSLRLDNPWALHRLRAAKPPK
jgi:type I restriction enzyme M protein